jgi:hypothetical protein
MYDWGFVRCVEAIAFRLEKALNKFYPSSEIKRSHWPNFSTIEAITEHHTGDTSEVGIELSLSLPVQDLDFQNETIDRMVDAISVEASCYVLPGYPDTKSEFLDSNGDAVEVPQSINTWRSFVPLDEQPKQALGNVPRESEDTSEERIGRVIAAIPHASYKPPNNFDLDSWNLEEVSPLKLFGYTVGANGLSGKKRKAFLDAFIKIDLPNFLNPQYISEWGAPRSTKRLQRIIRHISANIQRTSRNDYTKYSEAISDWESDLNWLQSKSLDDEIPF